MTNAGNLIITTPSDRELSFVRDFAAPKSLVFDAYTKPELVRRWMLGPDGWTMDVCEIDLRVGGAYRYEWRNKDGRRMAASGRYREIVAPERIVWTELFDEDWTGGEAVATIVLTESGGKTKLTQTMLYVSREARDGALGSGMEQGMKASYARMDALLVSQNPA